MVVGRRPREGTGQTPCLDSWMLDDGQDREALLAEREQLRRRIADLEAATDAAFAATHDGVLITDLAGHLVFHNQPFVNMWRLAGPLVAGAEDNTGLNAALAQMEDPAAFLAMAGSFAASPEAASDTLIPLKDGRLLEARSQPQRRHGAVVGRVWWFRDVTERHRIVQALRQSEERFSHLFLSSPFSILLATYPEGRIVDVNPAFTRLFERERDEVVGRTTNEINLWANTADRERMISLLQAGQPVQGMEFAFTTKSGDRRVVLLSIELVQVQGEWHALASSVDMTGQKGVEAALRESETRYRTLFEAVGETIYMVSEEGVFLALNHAFEVVTGWDRSDWLGRSFAELIHPDDLAPAFAVFQRAIAGDRDAVIDVRLRHRNGEYLIAECTAVHPVIEHGRITGFLGTGRDVTSQRRLEDNLRQAQKIEALGTLAGGIAHDFNNILSAVMGHAELLRRSLPDRPDLAGDMAGIIGATARAKALVRQILTFSRQHADEREVVEVAPLLREALALLRATLPATITIHAEFDAPGATILADPSQIHQVVVNLGTNAVHAMEDRGGTLRLHQRVIDPAPGGGDSPPTGNPPRQHVEVTITDTGHGMAPEVLRRIFDPFFTTKPPTQGTGLGMAVVHGIMRSHDGDISIESRPGEGTTVTLRFPAVAAAESVPAEPGTIPVGRGEVVMFVDDEPGLVQLVSRMLTQLGYQPRGFTSPVETLAAFVAAPGEVDLVFTDLTMPGMTGTELARQLLARRPDLPVVLASGYAGVLGPDELDAAGIRELVPKPFDLEVLAGVVARHLRAGKS